VEEARRLGMPVTNVVKMALSERYNLLRGEVCGNER